MCHKVVGVIVEGESDEKVLKEIFSKYGLNAEFRQVRGFKLGYNAPRHAPKIAHEMDVGKLEQKCDSFREMINIARD